MKDRYVNLFTDFGFKKIFGEELNKELLKDFLNQLLKGEQTIKELVYRKIEPLGSTDIYRKNIFDVYCENDKGERVVVEIQKDKYRFFKDRNTYYSTFPIAKQAENGDLNFEWTAVYTVAILDFVFDDQDKDKTVVSYVLSAGPKTSEVSRNKLTFVYLQMPNFNKTEDELETAFDKWLYVIKNLHKLQDRPKRLQEHVFETLFHNAEIARVAPQERAAFEDSLKCYRDLKNSFDTARAEGMAEGVEEGKAQGLRGAMVKVAESLIREGDDDDRIARTTGLSVEEIRRLRAVRG